MTSYMPDAALFVESADSTGAGYPSIRSRGPLGGSIVADVYGNADDGSDAESMARLFAASPSLLAVCQEIAEHGTDDWEARMRTLHAAIALATN